MTSEPRNYVQPDVNEARVNRLWLNVAERLETGSSSAARFWRWGLVALVVSGAAAGAFVLLRGTATPSATNAASAATEVLADAKLETGTHALAVTLGDGSSVQLGSRTALQVRGSQSQTVSLALTRGQVLCDVTHREGRKFSVVAGDVEVRVVGTKFSVKTTPGEHPRVEVSVLRGMVEVVSQRRPGTVTRVAAGQSWLEDAGNVVARAALEPPATKAEPTDSAAAANGVAVPDGAAPKLETPLAATASGASGGVATTASAVPSARELFEKAGESRRSGDAAAAARNYEELLRLHPSDGRASLSAFELGRLRMDRLADPAGAVTALERAVALNIGPSFREDALARLVSVYASQGNFAACARARDRYLQSYPAGVHASAVATRCGAK